MTRFSTGSRCVLYFTGKSLSMGMLRRLSISTTVQFNKINVFQVLTKETPFITKGAFALFYGEPTAVAQLPKTKEFLMTILLFFSLVFNLAVMVFKKLRFRSGSRQNNLNELIVGNFLNLMSFTKILLIVCVFLLFSGKYRPLIGQY